MKPAFKYTALTFSALIVLVVIAANLAKEPDPEASTAAAPAEAVAEVKTLDVTAAEAIALINAMSRTRGLPTLTLRNAMECKVACVSTYMQGDVAAYNFTAQKLGGPITSILQVLSNDGTDAKAMASRLAMATVTQALTPQDLHQALADEIVKMIESAGIGQDAKSTVAGLDLTMTYIDGGGLWFSMAPAK